MTGNPEDLCTIREAEAKASVSNATLWRWIRGEGTGGRKLPTYREPGEGTRVLVSLAQVIAFRDRPKRAKPGCGAEGTATNVTFKGHDRETALQLAKLMGQRLGCKLTLHDAVLLAVTEALRREVLAAAAKA